MARILHRKKYDKNSEEKLPLKQIRQLKIQMIKEWQEIRVKKSIIQKSDGQRAYLKL